jgi:hypothetical protein
MTEKVTPVSAFQKGTTKAGNPFYTVQLADGRQATCFDNQILQKLNQTIDVEVKQTQYNNQVEYVINFPGAQGTGGGKSGFNLGFNQRKTALECAVRSGSLESDEVIIERANKFLAWMNKP